MPPVTLSAVVDLSKIKMKWKEQYVSEGLNRKVLPAMPKGIYMGLRLIQNISSPRQVEVSSSPDGKHGAVLHSATGFALTYHDVAGVSQILDLSNVNLDNQETVITLSITYAIGADTTASWIAYPIADWEALTDGQRAERIVLGTVNVPAPATNITTSMITPDRRTLAWESEAGGNVPWSPVLRNPSFEYGVSLATDRYSISDWDKGTIAVNGAFQLGSTAVRSGAKSLEFVKTNVAGSDGVVAQFLEIPVVPGQLVKISAWIRQLIAPTAGAMQFSISWGDMDSIVVTTTDLSAIALATTDASFRKVERTVEVPSGAYVMKTAGFVVLGVTSGSTGVLVAVDDFQIYVESGSPQAIQGAANARLGQQIVSSVVFEDSLNYEIGQLAALLRYQRSTPTNEGSLRLERKDQVAGSLPPALSVVGRIVDLGNNLLGSEANALRARITAVPSTTGGVDYTLMWESRPTSGGTRAYRKYISASGSLVETWNAIWGGTTWSKDQNGAPAIKWETANGSSNIRKRDSGNDTPWSDGAWDSMPFNFDLTTPQFDLAVNMILGSSFYVQAPGSLYVARQIFTAGGTYTPTAGTKRALIRLVGGGGGGSGVGASATGGRGACGSGGNSGTYVEKTIWLGGTLITGGAVTIGALGNGGVGSNAGSQGGTSSIVVQGVTYNAVGGNGGLDGGSNLAPPAARRPGLANFSAFQGDFQTYGFGAPGILAGNVGDSVSMGGTGGSNPLGAGGQGVEQGNGNSADTCGYGGGGGGAANWQDANAYNGGPGRPGVVIVDEYF